MCVCVSLIFSLKTVYYCHLLELQNRGWGDRQKKKEKDISSILRFSPQMPTAARIGARFKPGTKVKL